MDVTTKQGPILTDDEIAILDRFKTVLNDLGVQATLSKVSAQARLNDGEVSTRILNVYLGDVGGTESRDMHEAGVSLREVVELARATGIFPEDFLPAQETVDKCVKGFWSMHRKSD